MIWIYLPKTNIHITVVSLDPFVFDKYIHNNYCPGLFQGKSLIQIYLPKMNGFGNFSRVMTLLWIYLPETNGHIFKENKPDIDNLQGE